MHAPLKMIDRIDSAITKLPKKDFNILWLSIRPKDFVKTIRARSRHVPQIFQKILDESKDQDEESSQTLKLVEESK